ncbi:hypothetical protein [Anaerocolumna sp.]|uniref:hypothetical protein n=1 Tax=Anaerocolumna sp. TaxID=2041569 RepID=UPI0028AB0E61|nr:hypothetical protein [Anaerocolumna sp.]
MKIREKFILENKEFIAEWEIKRKVGKIRYITVGIIRFALFTTAILLGNGLVNNKIELNSSDLITIVLISILAPIISWFANEYRYKNNG